MSPGFSTRPYRAHPRLAKHSHLNFQPPPFKTTAGPLSSCLLKRNQENTIWRKGSSHYLTTCTMSRTFSTRPCRTNPRLAKDSPFNFHPPPSKTTTGPLSSCLLKRSQKNTIWRKGSSHYVPTCTMSPGLLSFQLDQTRQAQDLPKIHLSTSTPPSKTTTGPLSSCLLKRNQKNTIWRKGSSHYVPTCTMSPGLLSFQLDQTRQAQDLPKIHLSTSTPPQTTTTYGSFVNGSTGPIQSNSTGPL